MLPLVELIADPRTVQEDGGLIRLTDEQARAILALTLSRLTGLGRDEIGNEAAALAEAIKGFLDLLSDRANIMAVVREELVEVRDKFAIPRRCQIVDGDADVEDEDLIVREDMVITVTLGGYVKRTPLAAYRTQHRGGKGKSGMATKTEDAVTRVFSASTHSPLLFFTSGGKVYKMKVWRLPQGVANSRGKAFVNLLPIEPGETITSILTLPEDEATWDGLDVMFATRSGSVRRNKLSRLRGRAPQRQDRHEAGRRRRHRRRGRLRQQQGHPAQHRLGPLHPLLDRRGARVRQPRLHRRARRALGEGDSVISMSVLRNVDATPAERAAYLKHQRAMARAMGEEGDDAPAAPEEGEEEGGEASLTPERIAELGAAEEILLTVSSEGFGKRTSAYDYRRTGRGGQGLTAQDLQARRQAGGLVPDRRQRPDPAGHRRRSTDPGARLANSCCSAEYSRRNHLPHGAGRTCRQRRAPRRSRRRRQPRATKTRRTRPRKRPKARGQRAYARVREKHADRALSGDLRPGHQRPPRHHRSGGQAGRQAGDRGGGEHRQGAAVLAGGTGGDGAPRNGAPDQDRRDRGPAVRQPADALRPRGQAQMIVRGLRAVADFEYEFQMTAMNQQLDREIETVFLMADPRHQAIASRLVKEIAALGGDVHKFVPPGVAEQLLAKVGKA
jgi:hypothetical protein